MAILTVLIGYTLLDAEGDEFRMPTYYLASEVDTLAKAQGVATTMAPLVSAISGCAVIGSDVSFPMTVPGGDTADAGYRGDAGATWSFVNTASRAHSLFVPGTLLSRMSAGVIDESAADVGSFINAVTTGAGITGGFIMTDDEGLKLSGGFDHGNQSTRKTKR